MYLSETELTYRKQPEEIHNYITDPIKDEDV